MSRIFAEPAPIFAVVGAAICRAEDAPTAAQYSMVASSGLVYFGRNLLHYVVHSAFTIPTTYQLPW